MEWIVRACLRIQDSFPSKKKGIEDKELSNGAPAREVSDLRGVLFYLQDNTSRMVREMYHDLRLNEERLCCYAMSKLYPTLCEVHDDLDFIAELLANKRLHEGVGDHIKIAGVMIWGT